MLIATLLSALSLAAVSEKPWTCDLAPSFGQGLSDEGRIDGITTVALGCRYHVGTVYGFELSPTLSAGKHLWSVYQTRDDAKNLKTYDIQSLDLGIHVQRPLTDRVAVFYGLAAGRGRGSLSRTDSDGANAVSGRYSDLTHSHTIQTLGAAYALNETLSLTLAWQNLEGRQSWSFDKGDFLAQSVADDKTLSLAEGSLNLTGAEERTSSRQTAHLIQLGISLSFGGR